MRIDEPWLSMNPNGRGLLFCGRSQSQISLNSTILCPADGLFRTSSMGLSSFEIFCLKSGLL